MDLAMAYGAVRSVRLTQLSLLSNTLHPLQLSHPQFLLLVVKIFWPPLPHIFILLNIKEPKLFLVPSLLVQPLLPMPVRFGLSPVFPHHFINAPL